jgi:glutaredoxin
VWKGRSGPGSRFIHAPGCPAREEPAMPSDESRPTVTIYTTSWCSSVHLAKWYLERNGIDYTEIDIDKVPEAARRVEQWTGGYRTVPTFDINGQIIVDFNVGALNKILGL